MTLKLVSTRNHPRPLNGRAPNPELDLDPVQISRAAQWALFGQTPEGSGVLAWYRSEWAALLGRKNRLRAYPNSQISVHHTPTFPDRLALIRAGLNLIRYEIIDQNEELRDRYYGVEEEATEFQGDPGDEIPDDEVEQFRTFLDSDTGGEEPEPLESEIDPHEFLKAIVQTVQTVTRESDGRVIRVNWPDRGQADRDFSEF